MNENAPMHSMEVEQDNEFAIVGLPLPEDKAGLEEAVQKLQRLLMQNAANDQMVYLPIESKLREAEGKLAAAR
jgi:hypothetical protein